MTPAASLCAFINILEKMRCVGFRLDWAYYLTAIKLLSRWSEISNQLDGPAGPHANAVASARAVF